MNEREIKDYLRREIPWWQRKRRRRADSLVASMGDLAARPPLLALVSELAAAGKEISELFELYEFMVERWLERERDWIEPDALRTAAEKLAVAICTRSSDRIDAAGVTGIPDDRWKFNARSLLQRATISDDRCQAPAVAYGGVAFTDRSVLEHCFISALLHGDAQCLSVRWSGFMRRLFVSATNVLHTRHGDAALRALLARSFAATGLFPLSDPHPPPKRLETAEILNATAAPPLTRLTEGPMWDPARYALEHHVDDSLYVCDRSSDAICFVPTDWRRVESGAVDPDSARLFLVTRSEADSQLMRMNDLRKDGRSDWRLPTLEELDLIFLLNQQLGFLSPEQYVWSGDQRMDGERLVARMRHSADDLDARINPIGARKVNALNATTPGYFVSSMPPFGVKNHRANFDASFPALLIRVSQGGAESFKADPASTSP